MFYVHLDNLLQFGSKLLYIWWTFCAFGQFSSTREEIGSKIRLEQRTKASTQAKLHHLQLHHPAKACEPELRPSEPPQAQPSAQLSSHLATSRQLSPT